jgi:molybdenum cofactor cytidylyltransferase
MTTALLLLAAGASRRFGPADKLLADVRGRPLVCHAAEAGGQVAVDHRLVVLSDPGLAALIPGFRPVLVPPGLPQSDSLKAGVAVAAALGVARVLVILGDMPNVSPRLMAEVLARGQDGAAAASDGTRIMPPVVLPRALFGAVAGLQGDRGAAALLTGLPPAQRVLAESAELVDIDLPGDLPPGPAAQEQGPKP